MILYKLFLLGVRGSFLCDLLLTCVVMGYQSFCCYSLYSSHRRKHATLFIAIFSAPQCLLLIQSCSFSSRFFPLSAVASLITTQGCLGLVSIYLSVLSNEQYVTRLFVVPRCLYSWQCLCIVDVERCAWQRKATLLLFFPKEAPSF